MRKKDMNMILILGAIAGVSEIHLRPNAQVYWVNPDTTLACTPTTLDLNRLYHATISSRENELLRRNKEVQVVYRIGNSYTYDILWKIVNGRFLAKIVPMKEV